MTDAELIAEARERWRDAYQHARTGPLLLALAARLEQLTAPAGKSPLTPGREAEIRDRVARTFPDTLVYSEQDCRDLLAALGWERDRAVHAEGVIQDQCTESACHEAGVREGVARALAVIEGAIGAAVGPVYSSAVSPAYFALCVLRNDVLTQCGPACQPPHAVTHARLLRLEAALGEMVRQMDGSSVFASRLCRAAREALGGES